MGHIPYGYRIEKGAAVIDKDAAARIKVLYSGYLGGLSLEAAAKEAGIGINHSRAKHILRDRRYLGDGFYPALIDRESFDAAREELVRRARKLRRGGKRRDRAVIKPPTRFGMRPAEKSFSAPAEQAEYLYSLIEIEVL